MLSGFGSQFTTVVMAWQIYDLTNSPLQIGMIGLARALPHCFNPRRPALCLAGHRFARRRCNDDFAAADPAHRTVPRCSPAQKFFWFSVLMLALCGAGDTISSILRSTANQLSTPDALRDRMSSINSLFTSSGPQLGQFESGVVAA
jgi:hypothetical protein